LPENFRSYIEFVERELKIIEIKIDNWEIAIRESCMNTSRESVEACVKRTREIVLRDYIKKLEQFESAILSKQLDKYDRVKRLLEKITEIKSRILVK
jgi:hypothetical protein